MSDVAPKISVLMSVYDAQDDLHRSMDSILNQTFRDFEFIIINDGSKDGSAKILEDYAARDDRIRLVHQANTGLTIALNRGIELARGDYIARQDSDDISYPERFEKQIAVMAQEPDVGLIGGNCDDLYEDGLTGQWGYSSDEELKTIPFFKTAFAHSTIMMRSQLCRDLGRYDESFKTSQDFEFWMRFAKAGRITMLSEPILQRRIIGSSISSKRRWRQFYDATRARWRHNDGLFMRLKAVFYGVRILLITMLPYKLVSAIKQIRSS
ncbi:MAG: glycosyltransferase [Cohaesibacter sp.]|nr:glycosyltransferase [Cohaesibacter sp.]